MFCVQINKHDKTYFLFFWSLQSSFCGSVVSLVCECMYVGAVYTENTVSISVRMGERGCSVNRFEWSLRQETCYINVQMHSIYIYILL